MTDGDKTNNETIQTLLNTIEHYANKATGAQGSEPARDLAEAIEHMSAAVKNLRG